MEDQGTTAGSSSKSSIGGNLIINILMKGSLGQVWKMIEGLQVVSHLPLFDLKSPGNVNAFNEYFAEIASFKIIDVTGITADIFYFPEMDSLSLNFQNAGYDTTLIIPSLGNLLYILFLHFCLAVVHLLLFVLAKIIIKVSKVKSKVARYLYWNGSIRFFMEGYFDFLLFALINVKHLNWSGAFWEVTVCNILSWTIIGLVTLLPLWIFIYLIRNSNKWQ